MYRIFPAGVCPVFGNVKGLEMKNVQCINLHNHSYTYCVTMFCLLHIDMLKQSTMNSELCNKLNCIFSIGAPVR